jgi:hypothetical protein
VLRVTNDSVTIEASYTGNAVVNSTTSVIDMGTVAYNINNMGQISGIGQGFSRTTDGSSAAAYTVRFTGSIDLQGNTNVQGLGHFTSLTTGKLADMSNTNTLFKSQINPAGYFTLQAWQRK